MQRFSQRLIQGLGHLLPWATLCLALLALWSFFRAIFVAWLAHRVTAAPEWGRVFTVGLRMDTVFMAYLSLLSVFLILVPRRFWARSRRPWQIYATLMVLIALFFELSTFQFLTEFDRRPDRLYWEYLNHPHEVVETLIKSAWVSLLAAIVLIPVVAWAIWRGAGWIHDRARPWPTWVGPAVFPVIGGLIFLCARGTLDHRPVNVSNGAFSQENLLNQLAVNSTFTGVFSLLAMRHEDDASKAYGKLDATDITAELRRASLIPEAAFTDAEIPFLHDQPARERLPQPRNLVIILQESFAAQFVGCLGGVGVTPEFDALSKEGLLLTRLYATGTRTVRGIEAVFAGFPPSPARSVVKLGLSRSGFATVADLLGRHDYATSFIYGGQSTFDDMAGFFRGNGVQEICAQETFVDPVFRGTWGVSDEDLMREADARFAAGDGRPFCSLVLSTSNHTPFEFPDGRITLHEEPKQTQNNAVKYADYAIGEFFRKARQRPYFANTIFIIVADHNIRTKGEGLVPVPAFHIPGLIIGPGFPPGSTHDRPCSQLDLLPTVLPHLGLDLRHPFLGHDLQTLPADHPGRAIMQFGDNNGYLLGDRLVVHTPQRAATCFRLVDGIPEPCAETWPDLEREALAHALASSWLYRERRHRLPADP